MKDELEHIRDMLLEGQGDDDGAQILPDFESGESVLSMVSKCLHLLEVRRDIIEADERTGDCDVPDRLRTIILNNGVEVPAPEREPLAYGKKYWVPEFVTPYRPTPFTWRENKSDEVWLERGEIYLSRRAAVARAVAVVAWIRQKEEEGATPWPWLHRAFDTTRTKE